MQKKIQQGLERGHRCGEKLESATIHPHLCLSKDVGAKAEKGLDQMDTHSKSYACVYS